MARRGPLSAAKRKREIEKAEKRLAKQEKRVRRAEEKAQNIEDGVVVSDIVTMEELQGVSLPGIRGR